MTRNAASWLVEIAASPATQHLATFYLFFSHISKGDRPLLNRWCGEPIKWPGLDLVLRSRLGPVSIPSIQRFLSTEQLIVNMNEGHGSSAVSLRFGILEVHAGAEVDLFISAVIP